MSYTGFQKPPSQSPYYTGPPPAYSAVPSGAGPSAPREPLLPREWEDDDVPEDFKIGTTVSQCDISIRMGFVRKVYSILTVQLFFSSLVGGICMYNDSARSWVQDPAHTWVLWGSLFATIGLTLALMWKRRSYPTNYILLGLFTLSESYTIGTIVTYYGKETVLQALILTLGLFVALTLFTLQSKWDFSGMGPFLFGALTILVLVSFVNMFFFPFSSTFELIMAVVIVIVFSGYVIFDTYMIMNRFSPEEYIVAAVDLYLDIINLFLAILRILAASKD